MSEYFFLIFDKLFYCCFRPCGAYWCHVPWLNSYLLFIFERNLWR